MENLETIKIEKKINKSVLMRIINFSKTLCIQAIIILTITLIYIKCNSTNYSDILVYFSFGLFISIFLGTIVLSILFSFLGIRIDENFVFFIQNKLLYIGIYSFQIFIIWRIGFHIKDVNTK
jgi:hypothetical protein